jgi:hypothetical protein
LVYKILFLLLDREKKRLFGAIPLGDVRQQINDPPRVSPLVIVPSDELDKVGIQLDASLRVKDGRGGGTDKVGGDDGFVGVVDDPLVLALGSSFHRRLDLVVRRALLEAHDEVDDGHVQSRHAERETAVSIMYQPPEKRKKTKSTYVSLPFREGMTLPTALAAPVEEGMMLLFTLRPPRQSLFDGPSTTFCVAVEA